MPQQQYFTRPANMAFHNFCDGTTIIPKGTPMLLGLNLKFCIEPPRPFQDIKKSLVRFQRDVRLHFRHNADEPEHPTREDQANREHDEKNTYIPSLYIPSSWHPPATKDSIEFAIQNFDASLNTYQ